MSVVAYLRKQRESAIRVLNNGRVSRHNTPTLRWLCTLPEQGIALTLRD
jgi:hypothetical protein